MPHHLIIFKIMPKKYMNIMQKLEFIGKIIIIEKFTNQPRKIMKKCT